MSGTEVVVTCRDADEAAHTMAADVSAVICSLQRDPLRVARVVLTGGSVARKLHRELSSHSEVDWRRVEIWWGDERFVTRNDPERNDAQAHEDLLGSVEHDPALLHSVAAAAEGDSEGPLDEGVPEALRRAAQEYALELEEALGSQGTFDLLMLGIGPDGHCASLFPGHPALNASAPAIAVTNSPKAPPLRVSFSFDTLQRSDRVWFVAAGAEKADAVTRSIAGGDRAATPSAAPRGTLETRWYLDAGAAGKR